MNIYDVAKQDYKNGYRDAIGEIIPSIETCKVIRVRNEKDLDEEVIVEIVKGLKEERIVKITLCGYDVYQSPATYSVFVYKNGEFVMHRSHTAMMGEKELLELAHLLKQRERGAT